MSEIVKVYKVKFVNSYEEFNKPLEVFFESTCPSSVKELIASLSAYYSGDPCECFIDGEKAVLEGDWGLLDA